MIFDQFSRYQACADLLQQAGFAAGSSVLDVGSGPECLFGQFMTNAEMTYVDPLISTGSGPGRFAGDIFSRELDGRSFDCVSAVDVLEHVPSESRSSFLERMGSLAKNTLILGFPTSDSSEALLVDEAIDRMYSAIFGRDYPWLEEHYRYGLPSLADTVEKLEQLGWHCKTLGHGHAPWLRELLGFAICAWDIPSMRPLVLEISEEFNRNFCAYDFRPPFYRQFVVATREVRPNFVALTSDIDDETANQKFRLLMGSAWQRYFAASLKELVATDAREIAQEQNLRDLSEWAVGLQTSVAERDEQVRSLTEKTQELAHWGAQLQTTITKRDEQVRSLTEKTQELAHWGAQLQTTITKRDEQVRSLTEKTQELAHWGAQLQTTITKRDEQVRSLTEKTQELAHWGTQLQITVAEKQAELMKISDWAYGMMLELKRRNATFEARCKSSIKRLVLLGRRWLAKSMVGDVVRHIIDRREYIKRQISIEVLKQSLKDNHGRLVVVFPVIAWDFRWQRPQHIVSRLRDHGYSVLYLAMTLTAKGRRLRGDKDAIAHAHFNELDRHINQIWLSSNKPVNIYTDGLGGDDLHNITLGLNALLAELRPTSIKYLIQFPGWWPVVKQVKEKMGGHVVFDCMDDHSGFSTNTQEALETEDALLKSADLVIASSDLLEQKARHVSSHVIQIKNGTEFKHFANPGRNGELDHLSDRPIVGYYGAISDWFDMKIVAHCARKFPNWNFVLIGSTFGANKGPVEGLDNVHFLGEKPYKDLPGYLAYFDVCTIPFKIIPLTLATNPIKFYEYLSAGKPVVSVELPELLSYQDDCYLASNCDEFVVLLERSYDERHDEKKIERRLKLASENSWDSRVRNLLESPAFKHS